MLMQKRARILAGRLMYILRESERDIARTYPTMKFSASRIHSCKPYHGRIDVAWRLMYILRESERDIARTYPTMKFSASQGMVFIYASLVMEGLMYLVNYQVRHLNTQ
jgi:hypothetical protein